MSGIVNISGSRTGILGTTVMRPSAFLAQKTGGNWNVSGGNTKITWDSVSGGTACFDIGGDFDTSNSRYVAPENGYYSFTVNMYSFQNRTSNYFTFNKNGSIMANGDGNLYFMLTKDHSGDTSLGNSMDMKLYKNDYVEVFTSGAADWYTGHSYFTGHRIF